MATTTNYGWTTPDDTALVKDGASAIRTLGTSVDTTTKNLNPSTTLGDIEYRSSTANTNTRVAIGSSGQALTVVAGVPSWAASSTSVLTTTGDTLYASGANTLARRAIGSTGDVLTVSGGLPTWAAPASGGMTLISTTTASNSASIVLSSIPATYNHLQVIVRNYRPATDNQSLLIRLNGDSASRYVSTAAATGAATWGNTDVTSLFDVDNGTSQAFLTFDLYDYANATTWKTGKIFGISNDYATPTNGQFVNTRALYYNQTAAISSITFVASVGNITSGTFLLYGVK